MTARIFSLAVASYLLMATALTPARAADMTFERALAVEKEPQNWLLHHGNYQGHRFSGLKEINTDTVKNLKLAFTVALGGFEGAGTRYKFGNLEATPIVEDGVIYVPDGWGTVSAIDVSSGKKGVFRWKFDPETNKAWAGDVACCGVNNRGVALWKDKVISISLDGRLFAINKATGEKVWERKIADPALGETLTLAPLIVRDVAIVGTAGGEFGIRGFIDGTDLNTGQHLWRTYTIPGSGEAGNETWKDGRERWKHGGGSIWETATYDPETDTFYQGIGNAGPDFDPEYRPGDNKWAASVLALNPGTGEIKWGFQYTPNDPYDFDEISEHPIIRCADLRAGEPWHAGAARGRQAVPIGIRRQELAAQRLQSATRAHLYPLDRGLRLHPDCRAEGPRRPGRPSESARALHWRSLQGSGPPPLRRSQGHRSNDGRHQGNLAARLCELCRSAGDRGQSCLPRPHRRHVQRL